MSGHTSYLLFWSGAAQNLWLSNFHIGKCCTIFYIYILLQQSCLTWWKSLSSSELQPWLILLLSFLNLCDENKTWSSFYHSDNLLDLQRISLEVFDRNFIGKKNIDRKESDRKERDFSSGVNMLGSFKWWHSFCWKLHNHKHACC